MPWIASALDYPTRPVHWIVGYPAGGGTNISARLMAQSLSERLGQPFVVENRAGASSSIATEIVVRARADGYTLLETEAAAAINATRTINATSPSCGPAAETTSPFCPRYLNSPHAAPLRHFSWR
jgi:tripartite-type tricarboxylate transporter receptor subunit TctC